MLNGVQRLVLRQAGVAIGFQLSAQLEAPAGRHAAQFGVGLQRVEGCVVMAAYARVERRYQRVRPAVRVVRRRDDGAVVVADVGREGGRGIRLVEVAVDIDVACERTRSAEDRLDGLVGGRQRDGGNVHRRATVGRRTAPTVDEHQRACRTQAAQCDCRHRVVAAPATPRPGASHGDRTEGRRGCHRLEQLFRIADTSARNIVTRQNLHRQRGFGGNAFDR